MPVKRTNAKGSRRLNDWRRPQLLYGPDYWLLAGVEYLALIHSPTFNRADVDEQTEVLAAMERDWRARGAVLLC